MPRGCWTLFRLVLIASLLPLLRYTSERQARVPSKICSLNRLMKTLLLTSLLDNFTKQRCNMRTMLWTRIQANWIVMITFIDGDPFCPLEFWKIRFTFLNALVLVHLTTARGQSTCHSVKAADCDMLSGMSGRVSKVIRGNSTQLSFIAVCLDQLGVLRPCFLHFCTDPRVERYVLAYFYPCTWTELYIISLRMWFRLYISK